MSLSVTATIKDPFPIVLDQVRNFDVIHFNSDGDIMVSLKGSTAVKFTSVTGGEIVIRGDTIESTGTNALALVGGTL